MEHGDDKSDMVEVSNGRYVLGHGREVTCCVTCGKPIEYVKRNPVLLRDGTWKEYFADHHCDPQHEHIMEGVVRREQEPREWTPCEADRMSEGFAMLEGNDE